jgi:hypothetical protein
MFQLTPWMINDGDANLLGYFGYFSIAQTRRIVPDYAYRATFR